MSSLVSMSFASNECLREVAARVLLILAIVIFGGAQTSNSSLSTQKLLRLRYHLLIEDE